MKTQITFKKHDGGEGVALVSGHTSDTAQAKQELAKYLNLPADASSGQAGDIDGRLEQAGIDPRSVQAMHISE